MSVNIGYSGKIKKKSIYNYENVWVLSSQNGNCYHMGRVAKLSEIHPGDTGEFLTNIDTLNWSF